MGFAEDAISRLKEKEAAEQKGLAEYHKQRQEHLEQILQGVDAEVVGWWMERWCKEMRLPLADVVPSRDGFYTAPGFNGHREPSYSAMNDWPREEIQTFYKWRVENHEFTGKLKVAFHWKGNRLNFDDRGDLRVTIRIRQPGGMEIDLPANTISEVGAALLIERGQR